MKTHQTFIITHGNYIFANKRFYFRRCRCCFFLARRCYLPTLGESKKKRRRETTERTANELSVFSLEWCVSYENKPICHRSTYTCSRTRGSQRTNVRWYCWGRQRQRESQDHFISVFSAALNDESIFIYSAHFSLLFYVYQCSAFCWARLMVLMIMQPLPVCVNAKISHFQWLFVRAAFVPLHSLSLHT